MCCLKTNEIFVPLSSAPLRSVALRSVLLCFALFRLASPRLAAHCLPACLPACSSASAAHAQVRLGRARLGAGDALSRAQAGLRLPPAREGPQALSLAQLHIRRTVRYAAAPDRIPFALPPSAPSPSLSFPALPSPLLNTFPSPVFSCRSMRGPALPCLAVPCRLLPQVLVPLAGAGPARPQGLHAPAQQARRGPVDRYGDGRG